MKKTKSFNLKPLVAGMFITSVVATASLSYTGQAHATMPTYDPGNHVTAIWNNMKRMMEAAKEQEFLNGQIQAIGQAASDTIDSFNNGIANIVARTGLGEQERQHLEQLQRAAPAKDVCSTVRVSKGLGEAACETLDQIASIFKADRPRHNMATGNGTFVCDAAGCSYVDRPPTAQEVSNKNTHDAKVAMETCAGITDSSGESLCGEASLIVAPPGGELTEEEYKAMLLKIDIAANLETPKPYADASLPKESPQFKRAQAQDMRRENMRQSAKLGQILVATKFRGTNMGERVKGDVQLLEEYLNDRLGSENWMCEVTNSCDGDRTILMPDGTYRLTAYVTPEELEKRKIQMEAVMLHIQLEQYKSMLRTEKYLSDIMLMEIDPVQK